MVPILLQQQPLLKQLKEDNQRRMPKDTPHDRERN
jgi:hypothetical protein